jgi:UDP-GlcNAc:undecaprenyl-phosphate GlcNAc-1-phosphate transferase
MNALHLILPFAVGAGLTAVLTPLVIRVARQHRVFDQPDERKNHKAETPRLGGVAMALAVLLGGVAAMLVGEYWFQGRFLRALLVGYGPVFLVSLRDDIRPLGWWLRFPVQIAGATAFVLLLGPIQRMNLPLLGTFAVGIWGYPLSVGWLLLTINAMNFIDGIDGLAAGIGAIAGTVLMVAVLPTGNVPAAALAAVVAGACAGFLFYNFPPARVFMGDSGATLVGFTLGAVALVGAGKNVAFASLMVPMLALAVPIVDAVRVLLHRSWRGRGLFEADRGHVHHLLLSLGLGERRTLLLLYLVTALAGGVALFLARAPRISFVFIGLLTLACAALLLWRGRVRN